MGFRFRNKSVFAIAGTLFLVVACVASTTAQTSATQPAAKKVADIQKVVAESDRLANTAERDEYSSVFIVELNVNPKENPYPAVGTFTSTVRFYYTYGDREKNPYPNKLLKIAITTRRSSTTERTIIYFRSPGEMILYSKKVEGEEPSDWSFYTLLGFPIQFEKQGKVVSMSDPGAIAFHKEALAEKVRLEKIFQAAIE